MAKQRSFFDKVVQKVRRDAGYGWTHDYMDILLRIAEQSRVQGEFSDLTNERMMPNLQQEAYLRIKEDEYYESRGEEPPEPLLFPGLTLAWEEVPVTVQVDDELVALARKAEANFASMRLDDIRALFPACLLIDVRNREVEMYGISVDALFVYPSFDADCRYELLLIVGVSLRHGLFEPLCGKYVMAKEFLGEAMDHTVEERERLRRRCMSGTDYGLHGEIFSPYEDEEKIVLLAMETLGLMLWEGAVIDTGVRRGRTHLRARRRAEGEGPLRLIARRTSEVEPALEKRGTMNPLLKTGSSKGCVSQEEESTLGSDSATEPESDSGDTSNSGQAAESAPAVEAQEIKAQMAKPAVEPVPEPAAEVQLEPVPIVEAVTEAGPGTTATSKPAMEAKIEVTQTIELVPETKPKPQPETCREPGSFTTAGRENQLESVLSQTYSGSSPLATQLPDVEHDSGFEEELLEEIACLEQTVAEQGIKIASLTYHLQQSRSSLEETQRALRGMQGRAQILESMELPTSPLEALDLAGEAFVDRIIVLEQARRSAKEFVRGSAPEVWSVLRSMATVLHPLVFGQGGHNVVYAFVEQTGYELTLREMKQIKRVDSLSRLRYVDYKGEKRSIAAHVKGRGRARGETLRVHFLVDYDEQRIVIAHCGEHLATYDTSSL